MSPSVHATPWSPRADARRGVRARASDRPRRRCPRRAAAPRRRPRRPPAWPACRAGRRATDCSTTARPCARPGRAASAPRAGRAGDRPVADHRVAHETARDRSSAAASAIALPAQQEQAPVVGVEQRGAGEREAGQPAAAPLQRRPWRTSPRTPSSSSDDQRVHARLLRVVVQERAQRRDHRRDPARALGEQRAGRREARPGSSAARRPATARASAPRRRRRSAIQTPSSR